MGMRMGVRFGREWGTVDTLQSYLGPLLVTWFNFNPACIRNYIHYKVWDEIAYSFINFNGYTVEVYEWISNFIWHYAKHVIIYPCWD